MGRNGRFFSDDGLNRGAWSHLEDKLLVDYIKVNGAGNWRTLSERSGLKRCRKSCRHRWLNYLRPDIKRGNISHEEEDLIIRLHKILGNRWSLITKRLPGRTDNEIKNYWNTNLKKRITSEVSSSIPLHLLSKEEIENPINISNSKDVVIDKLEPIRTKAMKCTKVFVSLNQDVETTLELQNHDKNLSNHQIIQEQSQCEVMEPFNEDVLLTDLDPNVVCDVEKNDDIDFESLSFWFDFENVTCP